MLRDFTNYLLPSIFRGALSFAIVVPVTTYYLNPEDFGIIAYIGLASSFLGPLTASSATPVLYSWYQLIGPEKRGELLFSLLAMQCVFSLLLALPYALIAWLFLSHSLDTPEPTGLCLGLATGTILAGNLWAIASSYLTLARLSGSHAMIESAGIVTFAAAMVIGLAILKLGIVAFFVAGLSSALVSMTLAIWLLRNHISCSFSTRWIREFFNKGLPNIPPALVEMASMSLDTYFIKLWLGLVPLGYYLHSQSYRNVMTLSIKAFTRTVSPASQELYAGHGGADLLRRQMTFWYILLGMGAIAVGLFHRDIVNLLSHGKFNQAAPLLPIWFLMMVSYSFGAPYCQALLAQQRIRLLAISNGVAAGVQVALVAAGTYWFGIIGAGSALVLGNLLTRCWLRWQVRRQARFDHAEWYALLTGAILALACAIPYVLHLSLTPRIGLCLAGVATLALACRRHLLPELHSILAPNYQNRR